MTIHRSNPPEKLLPQAPALLPQPSIEEIQMNEASTCCQLIRAGSTYQGKQDLTYLHGVSKETVGAQAICMHVLTMPPGARAKPHLHEHHETAIYVLSGRIDAWYGEQLEHHIAADAGDLFYIPAGVPHLPANLTASPASAIVARTDPNEQESVLLLPHLDARGVQATSP